MKKIGLIILFFSEILTWSQTSPFNKISIKNDSTSNSYSFIVSGHFYGNRYNNTGIPCNTLLANLNWINQSENNFVMCLGDLFMDISNDIPTYKKYLFTPLKKPLFNAVGNHDLTKNIYQNNFGKTFYSFQINNDLHIILDTEKDDGNIEDEQLEMLNNALKTVSQSNINNVFIYSHRTVWARSYKKLDNLFKDNTQSVFGNNFKDDVLPLLNQLSKQANVFWFSGSLGDAPASFFYFENDNLHYIATAIRGLKRDAVLIVNVTNDKVSFETKSFTNNKVYPLTHYNVEFWDKTPTSPSFNYRLIPLYIKQTLLHRYFWIGVIVTLLLVFGLRIFVKRKK